MRPAIPLLLLILLLAPTAFGARNFSVASAGEKRVALVIGNKNYRDKGWKPLPNALNDASDMKTTLTRLGFEVIHLPDATREQMDEAMRDFTGRIDKNTVVLFYFAGHGTQVDNANYLIPVGASIQSKTEVKARAYEANVALGNMEEAGARVSIVILDACRSVDFRGYRSGDPGGLAQMGGGSGSIIAFATAPGDTAEDGSGRNGTFTKHLLKHIAEPGLTAVDALQRVQTAVADETGDGQKPWVNFGPLRGKFCFAGCGDGGAPAREEVAEPVRPDPAAVELALWDSIKDSADPADFEEYLNQYPRGKFAGVARNRIKRLTQRAEAEVEERPSRPAPRPPEPEPYTPPARACAECPEMVRIPGGEFWMGSDDSDPEAQSNEKPRHRVRVAAFKLGKYEVTKGRFAAFVADSGYQAGSSCWTYEDGKAEDRSGSSWKNPAFPQGNDHPVACVSLEDAQAYLRWLNRKSGRTYRLPTEAEWEYAARAGTTTIRHWGNAADGACRYANVYDQTAKSALNYPLPEHSCSDGYVYTAPVGSFQANGFGLYDMQGNVWE